MGEKKCTICDKTKEEAAFYLRKDTGQRGNCCKKCLYEKVKKNPERREKNKMFYKNNPLYYVWNGMKQRCNNRLNPSYARYGGRGIRITEEWLIYKNFEKDMLPGYKRGLTIDRIDNNKGYYKANCRWATQKEQAVNRRSTHLFEYQRIKKTLTDWAAGLGIPRSTLSMRIYVYNWSVEEALEYNMKTL